MALKKTLAQLIEAVREQADMVGSDFVSDAWITARLNSHAAALHDILVSKGEDYFTTPVSFPVDGTQDSYDLPDSCYKLMGVDYQLNGQPWPMKKFMFNERHRFNIVNTKLPAQTLTLWVTPPLTILVDPTDELDGVNGWEDYVIYATAIDALTKEESDITETAMMLAKVQARIESMSADRDQGSPERIKDVTSLSEYPWLSENSYRYRVMGNKIYFIGCVSV